MSESNQKNASAVAREIAEKLGETNKKPRRQITSIVKLCGVDFAQKILDETLEIQANGGMSIQDGSRKRTTGGIFFYLAREQMSEENEQEIFYTWRARAKRREEREAQFPEFEWQQRPQVLQPLFENAGKVSEVKVNLVGRPEEIERRQNLVILTMQDRINEEMVFPSGVPQPSSDSVNYAVYISAKQWERVEEAIKAPDDELVIDGTVAYDADTSAMAVFTTYVTTRKLMQKNKKQQKNAPKPTQQQKKPTKRGVKNDRFGRNAPQPNETLTRSHETVEEKPAEPEINIDLPPGIPSQAAQKLVDLHKAAATFRQKIATLEEKPVDQQFGLEMTQKLLKNTESQIDKLEKQYAKDG